jgi:hypothetical protein
VNVDVIYSVAKPMATFQLPLYITIVIKSKAGCVYNDVGQERRKRQVATPKVCQVGSSVDLPSGTRATGHTRSTYHIFLLSTRGV